MELNYLLIIFAAILLFCVIRGATKGILRIVFGLVAWIFLICFVNYGSDIAEDFISINTNIPATIQEGISQHLHERYTLSEEREEGTGEDAVFALIPYSLRDKLLDTMQNSIDSTIKIISDELTSAAIRGISTIICVIIGILIIFIISKLIKLIGLVPGIRGVNRFFGVLAGFVEGLLIIWLIMFIANCFSTSSFGEYIISNTKSSSILLFLYENNPIENFIGLSQ